MTHLLLSLLLYSSNQWKYSHTLDLWQWGLFDGERSPLLSQSSVSSTTRAQDKGCYFYFFSQYRQQVCAKAANTPYWQYRMDCIHWLSDNCDAVARQNSSQWGYLYLQPIDYRMPSLENYYSYPSICCNSPDWSRATPISDMSRYFSLLFLCCWA